VRACMPAHMQARGRQLQAQVTGAALEMGATVTLMRPQACTLSLPQPLLSACGGAGDAGRHGAR